ncbi:YARHG domain-containing protein [Dinghuibacter silviterrae]|uniref:YARHG domain-containing protein n=1 Tax=Dinghuibacter silviterrae TaxID=1539049 RepID=A0A4R8DVD9_9BACT|nr:YARHG domain-containing protein [Dinghuibacter silviterrae]TDX02159.1 YARHG domain-containing protein [Dinghuibacter silviterrae]
MTPTKWMMPVIALFSFAAGCKNPSVVKDTAAAHTLTAPANSITGTWTGMFEPTSNNQVSSNKITLFIDQMDGGNIYGYSVCAGNDRPFKGTYTDDGDKITATLKEPGNGDYDGTFALVIQKNPLSLSGTWTPFKSTLSSRQYTLVRKNFVYDPAAGRYAETSARLLTSDDVNNLLKDELRYMRNEIFARHGYSFKIKEVRAMFDNQDWYMPISTDVRKKLTGIETANANLIKRYESYADSSYDDYGR